MSKQPKRNSPDKTYRIWKELQPLLEAKAQAMNLTPAKALNVLLAQALGSDAPDIDDEDDTEEPLPDIATHDAF